MHHDTLVAAVRTILRRAGARPFDKEVQLRSLGITVPLRVGRGGQVARKKFRMDVGAVGFPHLRTELADVVVAGHSQRRVRRLEAGSCAKMAARAKVRKYGPAISSSGHRFTPVATDIYGWVDEMPLGRAAEHNAQK